MPQPFWTEPDELVEQTLLVSESERRRLMELEDRGVSTVRPVALPKGGCLVGNNLQLGWPVGVQAGKTLLCAYRQTLKHHGMRDGLLPCRPALELPLSQERRLDSVSRTMPTWALLMPHAPSVPVGRRYLEVVGTKVRLSRWTTSW